MKSLAYSQIFQLRNQNPDSGVYLFAKRAEEVVLSQAKRVYKVSLLSGFVTVLRAPVK